MDRFEALRAFRAVVDEGGFAAAARRLGVSRSAVHKLVSRLEQELGAQLLSRSTRRVTPTETGRAFHARAGALLDELAEAVADVAERQARPVGQLRVNAPMSFGVRYLSPLIAAFMATYPELRVELSLADRLVDPLEEGFDVTVRIAEPRYYSSLVTQRLAPVRQLLCASPAYLDAAGEPRHPRELRRHRCLNYGYLATGNQWRLAGPDGDVLVPVDCVMWSNNGEVLRDAAEAGCGIAWLPDFVIADAVRAGRLRPLMCDYRPAELDVSALYPRHRHLSSKVRLLVDHLAAHLGDPPAWALGAP